VDDIQRQVDAKRADLVRAGWRVLNFSNERVATRSYECVAELEAAVASYVRPRPVTPTITTTRTRDKSDNAGVARARAPESTITDQKPQRSIGPAIAWTGLAALALVAGVFWVLGQQEDPEGSSSPQGQTCPGDAPVKGNINDAGEKIYHEPGWRYYAATWPEACFSSASDAEGEGYRASEVR
jgi:hypothetical protein